MLLHGGDRKHALVGVLEVATGFVRLDASRLQQQNAGDDLQAVGDAMAHLFQQQFLLAHKLRKFALRRAPPTNVLDGEQERHMRVALRHNRPRIEQHGAAADLGKLVLDLVAVEHRLIREDLFQKCPQHRNVPLAVTQRVKQPPLRIIAACLKRLVERAASGDDAQILVQHQQRLAHSVDDGAREGLPVLKCGKRFDGIHRVFRCDGSNGIRVLIHPPVIDARPSCI